MTIRQLSETLINQIAAGEVIERPASAAKELIENALDAGATRIEIATAGGGKTLLRVTDNGGGMGPADLELAIRRHCTSKLDKDLLDIRTLGFRGEALPSIGSVARLTLLSRTAEAGEGAEISGTG
uniref:DNA mismatch repair endonuclease MutL n=1 Tax=Shinella sp. TaxID=1870904 RepID=UPI0028AB28C8